MNLFSRLCIGTASWGAEYNGTKVSEHDQEMILDYAQCSGIDMIDTATAYGVDWTKWNNYFKIVLKVNHQDNPANIMELCKDKRPYCIMAHDLSYYPTLLRDYGWSYTLGASLYDPGSEVNVFGGHTVQIPYSLWDRRFEDGLKRSHEIHEIHVRSIFLRGRILEKTSPQECIKFCLCNPHIDRVIIGADSYEQFKDNVHFIHEWNRLEKHDEALLDPRRWPDSGR